LEGVADEARRARGTHRPRTGTPLLLRPSFLTELRHPHLGGSLPYPPPPPGGGTGAPVGPPCPAPTHRPCSRTQWRPPRRTLRSGEPMGGEPFHTTMRGGGGSQGSRGWADAPMALPVHLRGSADVWRSTDGSRGGVAPPTGRAAGRSPPGGGIRGQGTRRPSLPPPRGGEAIGRDPAPSTPTSTRGGGGGKAPGVRPGPRRGRRGERAPW